MLDRLQYLCMKGRRQAVDNGAALDVGLPAQQRNVARPTSAPLRRSKAGAAATALAVLSLTACNATSPDAGPTEATVTQTVTQTPSSSPTPDAPVTTVTESASVPPSPTTPSSGEADWTDVVAEVSDAVVRLDVASCDARWMGTGFIVGDHEIMTAAHVAIDAQTIGVQGEGLVTSAEVVGLDPDADVALLYTATDLSAQTVQLSEVQPPLGAPVALLGFPLAVTDLRITQGVVSGVNAEAEYPDLGMSLSHLLATDAAINGGNSGGPALDRQGNVIGLVTGKRPWEVDGEGNISAAAEGTGYVVPSDQLRPRLAEWQDQVPADGGIGCEGDEAAPIESYAGLTVEVLSDEEVAQDIARSLLVHGESINTGRYRTAWEIFTPRMEQLVGPFEEWKAALVTSYWTRLRLITVVDGGGTASVQTELTTKQDAAYGQEEQTCSQWSLTYQMVRSGAGWLMDGVDNAPGSPQAC